MYGTSKVKCNATTAAQENDDSDFSEEEEDEGAPGGIPAEDTHNATKVILQRQFFEALVRAAAVKYANNSELPTLSQKLEHLFKHQLVPFATKNKAKGADDDKNFKIGESVFSEYNEQLRIVFKYFSQKQQAKQSKSNALFGMKEDITLDVTEVINLF